MIMPSTCGCGASPRLAAVGARVRSHICPRTGTNRSRSFALQHCSFAQVLQRSATSLLQRNNKRRAGCSRASSSVTSPPARPPSACGSAATGRRSCCCTAIRRATPCGTWWPLRWPSAAPSSAPTCAAMAIPASRAPMPRTSSTASGRAPRIWSRSWPRWATSASCWRGTIAAAASAIAWRSITRSASSAWPSWTSCRPARSFAPPTSGSRPTTITGSS